MTADIRIVRCPSCGKGTRYDLKNPDRPFCSERCRIMDIAQWADEGYRIPQNSSSDELQSELDAEDDDYDKD